MKEERENDIRFSLRILREREPSPTYETFTADTDPVEAVKVYRNKYNDEPAEIFSEFGLIWCGPVNA